MATADSISLIDDGAVHTLTIKKCVLRRGYVSPRGDAEVLPLKEAVKRLAPSGTRSARVNVLRARPGHYIGVTADMANFVFKNATNDGDIRWIILKKPDFERQVREIYLVEDCVIAKNSVDLPGDPELIP